MEEIVTETRKEKQAKRVLIFCIVLKKMSYYWFNRGKILK